MCSSDLQKSGLCIGRGQKSGLCIGSARDLQSPLNAFDSVTWIYTKRIPPCTEKGYECSRFPPENLYTKPISVQHLYTIPIFGHRFVMCFPAFGDSSAVARFRVASFGARRQPEKAFVAYSRRRRCRAIIVTQPQARERKA